MNKQTQIDAFNRFIDELEKSGTPAEIERDCYFADLIANRHTIVANIRSDFPWHGSVLASLDEVEGVRNTNAILKEHIAKQETAINDLLQYDVRELRRRRTELEAAIEACQQETTELGTELMNVLNRMAA